MSKNIISYQQQADGSADVTVPAEHVAEFKQLVARAMNTWERASPEMRSFSDRVSGLASTIRNNNKVIHDPDCDCWYCSVKR